ncbi:MAG: PD40 domain-containing protein [Gemmatimonadetes bacterium]|nr:PD40 domain-containing protein [Gemmatimonadota bacterium]
MMRTTTLFLALALCLPAIGTAQLVPFGKNKIQYRGFNWQVLSGEHVDVYYYPEGETLARLTLAYAEESYRFLERKFQHHPFRRIPLIVYSSDQHFEQTNVFPGFIPEGVLGFTEYLKRRVALPFRGDYAQYRHTLRHELVHAFQLSKLSEVQSLHPRQRRVSPQQIHWWTEGLAEFWSSAQTPEDDMFVRDLVLTGKLPTIRQFNYLYSFASYPLGAELHKYLAGRFGEEYIVELYEEYWKYDSFEQALEATLGVDLDRLSREFRYELEQRYFPIYAQRAPLEVGAVPVVHKGGANFKPVLYLPPGDSVPELLFLSPRSGYTNIYRTRLDEGEKGISAVVEGERSAEFESFHAYESRIDVSSGGVVAFISKYMERDALFLWNLQKAEIVGRYQWPDLVGLKSPSWDPTGTKVVFEGLSTAGFSDLYTVNFTSHERAALTGDRYRDEDPDWAPDGRSIVFASDRTRFGVDGHKNLFVLDLETRQLRYLTYGSWNDQDPRWSRDGKRIAFSSDRGGIYDIYAVDAAGNGRRLTDMAGGEFDPEWLPGDRGLVFTGFSEGTFRIYKYSFPADTATAPAFALADNNLPLLALGDTPASNGELPLGWEWSELDEALVKEAKPQRYNTWQELSLDFAGGDAVVAPGVGAAQGAQFLASDMLGNHILFAGISAVQAQDLGELVDNFSGHLLYLNLAHRLNFGAGAFRFKGLFRDVAFDIYQEETYGGYFVASYPFSKFRRLELQLGLERSNRTDIQDAFEQGVFGRTTRPDPRDLTREGVLTSNYLSYVKDNTLWLPTGPIDGERFNLTAGLVTCFSCTSPSEVSGAPVTRSATAENYVVIGDYRRYVRTSLLSAYAFRAYVFYSDGAIPDRAVLGGPHRLRGYPRFALAGSRVWLLNQEWRFPLLHRIGLAFPFGELRFPGIQGALFVDAGSSWLEDQKPEGTWGSYGLGLRTSLGPPLVLRLDIGRRFRLGELPPVVFDDNEGFGDTFVDFFFGFNY